MNIIINAQDGIPGMDRIMTTTVNSSSGSDARSKTEQFLKDICSTSRSTITTSPRPKSSLSPKIKVSVSTGSLKGNKISFGEVRTLVFEKEIDGHDQDHKNTVWYSKEDLKSIRKDLKKSIRKGELSRGLEKYEGDFGKENQKKRLHHVYSILDLQRQQQEKGVYDDDEFQMLSRTMSASHIERARRLASMDSTEAFHEYQKTTNHIIRTSSRNALDNFRKTLSVQADIHTKGRTNRRSSIGCYGFDAANAGSGQGVPAGKNATFETLKNKSSEPNLLLQRMASKQQGKMMPTVPGVAGVA